MCAWYVNRLTVTGQSAFIDELQSWVCGNVLPYYRHAILQSQRLFLAGCGGILKPVKKASFPAFPALIPNGAGEASLQNQAFEQWLGMLQADTSLTIENIRQIERLYRQSGIDAIKWESMPAAAQQRMADVIERQYADWFGVVTLSEKVDAARCWERLADLPETTIACDMLMLLPSRLATELNGSGGLLKGIATTTAFYCWQYGVSWPAGNNVGCTRDSINCMTVFFDSAGAPPASNVVSGLSGAYSCQIVHTWYEQGHEQSGYDCYDCGNHVDSRDAILHKA